MPAQASALFNDTRYTGFIGGLGCIHDSALIETIDGKFHPSEIKKPTRYKSYYEGRFVFSEGTKPFKKGCGELYKIKSSCGEFVAYKDHKVLCNICGVDIYQTIKTLYDEQENNKIAFNGDDFCLLELKSVVPYKKNRIINIEKYGKGEYWDLHVPITNNYVANGAVHHNSGKTWLGAHFTLKMVQENKGSTGLIAANTYAQLRDSTLAGTFEVFDDMGIEFDYKESKSILTLQGQKILCRSMEKYDRLRGVELGWGWCDEVRDMKEEAHKVLLGRVRHKKAVNPRLLYTTTPCGFNWLQHYFAGKKKTAEYTMFNSHSRENVHLPDGYLDAMESSYDDLLIQQEMGGMFINIHSLPIYYSFDRNRHCQPWTYDENFPIFVGMDFNVNPMTAVVCQFRDHKVVVIDEVWIMSSETREMCDHLIDLYPKEKMHVIPDSTGKALKSSSAGESDHSIIREKGLNLIDTINPRRRDRYNCVNNNFHKGFSEIAPKCQRLMEDLEQAGYKKGTDLEDKSNPLKGHLTDCYGYVMNYFFPFKKPSRDVFQTVRIR